MNECKQMSDMQHNDRNERTGIRLYERDICPHCGGTIVRVHSKSIEQFFDNAKALSANKICREVARRFCMTSALIKSDSRKAPVVAARTEAMRRCRYELGMTLEEIGEIFNRSHSAVLHLLRKGNA